MGKRLPPKLKKMYSALLEQIATVEQHPNKKSIVEYTKHMSKVNEYLENGDEANIVKYIGFINSIDSVFEPVKPIEEPLTVYRGVRHDYQVRPFEDRFISTSLLISVAARFSGPHCCILKITIPSGSKILPVRTVSAKAKEEEILLPRKGRFILHHTTTIEIEKRTYGYKHLTYIPDGSTWYDQF